MALDEDRTCLPTQEKDPAAEFAKNQAVEEVVHFGARRQHQQVAAGVGGASQREEGAGVRSGGGLCQ